MVYLNLQIDQLIDSLDASEYIPHALTLGGGHTATVASSQIEPAEPVIGDLWFNTATSILYIYNGTQFKEISLTATEKEQLASLATYVSLGEVAKIGAETAQGLAETAQSNAETSATNAATSETNAAASASAAAQSALDAATFEPTNYYLKTELDAGQLDNRYYTETEVDALLDAQDQATELVYDNTTSGLTATTVQAAIDEVEGRVDTQEAHNHDGTYEPADATILKDADIGVNVQSVLQSSYTQLADASLGTGTHTFDYSLGDMQQLTATGAITVAFSNMPTGKVCSFIIDAVNWGDFAITLPVGMIFDGATAPTFTSGGTDRLVVLKDKDDVYSMFIVGQGIA